MPFDPPLTHCAAAAGRAEAPIDCAALPDAPGVVVFEAADGRTVFLGVGASVRRLARSRLGPRPEGDRPARSADLRPVTARVLACVVGSPFEADAAYLALARARRPADHRAVTEQWQGWFMHIDPAAAPPKWTKLCMPGWTPGRSPAGESGGALVGPFRDKHAAGKYGDLLDDLFDLCRYPHILALAPRGTACAYKEMGKCPAPCDGSEAMESYRARVARAIAFARTPAADACEQIAARMRDAAAAHRFEDAARERALLERAEAARKPAYRFVGALEDFRWVVVTRCARPGWARVTLVIGGEVEPLADVRADVTAEQLGPLVSAIVTRAHARPPCAFSEAEQETVGLVCSHLFAPAGARRRIQFVRIPSPGRDGSVTVPVSEIRGAIRRAAARRGGDGAPWDGADRCIEDPQGQSPPTPGA